MMRRELVVCLWVFLTNGVFGAEVEEVRKVKGDCATLHSSVQKYQRILWLFGHQKRKIAQCWGNISETRCDITERLDRLKIDRHTGSLTINNITKEDSGHYHLQIFNDLPGKEFNVIISSPLPIPSIVKDSEKSSCSHCVLKCSVMNVTETTLSWYKDKRLISSSSGSDLNNSFSLPLELIYQDINIYSCVLNDSFSNQTKHLNITELCQPCPVTEPGYIVVLGVLGVLVLVLLGGIGACICWKKRRDKQKKRSCRVVRGTDEESSGDSTDNTDERSSLETEEESQT